MNEPESFQLGFVLNYLEAGREAFERLVPLPGDELVERSGH